MNKTGDQERGHLSARAHSPLVSAFLEDHQHMMRGLAAIIEALEHGKQRKAVAEADELNRVSGAHIQFEEEVLYPEVERARGTHYSSRLFEEHDQVRRGIECLLTHEGEERLSPDLRQQVLEDFRVGLQHAAHCGTLLSHLTVLDRATQDAMLKRLLKLRKNGMRWLNLSRNRG